MTDREIAQKLNRTENGIRNIRYRKKLAKMTLFEIGMLKCHEKEPREKVESLTGQCQELSDYLGSLGKEKEKLESTLNVDKSQLQLILVQALTALKQQRPDLFILSEREQIVLLTQEFLGRLSS